MKKNKVINFLKSGTILFGFSLLLWSCEKEISTNEHYNEHFGIEELYKKEIVNYETLKNNSFEFSELAKKVAISKKEKGNSDFKYIYYLHKKNIVSFKDDKLTTYTIPVLTTLEQNKNDFFNLVIKKTKQQTISYVIKYSPSNEWLANKLNKTTTHNFYKGGITIYDAKGEVISRGNITDDNYAEKSNKKRGYSSKESGSGCVPGLEPNYKRCGCGGNANGHSPSGAPCCKGSPLMGYKLNMCIGGGDGSIGNPDFGGGNGSGGNGPTEPTTIDSYVTKLEEISKKLSEYNVFINSEEADVLINNNILYDTILYFLQQNPNSEEARGFVKEVLKVKKENPNAVIDFEDRIINQLTGQDKCIYNKLKELNLFKATIRKFERSNAYNLKIKYGNCTTTNTACTDDSEIDKGLVTIIIETGAGGKPLDFATALLHEGIHAEISRYVYRYEKGYDPNKRPNLLNYYFFYKAKGDPRYASSNAQHQHMADKFVKPIAEAIRKLDNYSYPLEYYMGFGWDGLRRYGYDGYFDNGKWVSLTKNQSSDYYKKQKIVNDNTKLKDNECE
ncbi:hypothetical protein [Tenacibaculum halocynthiae]|uniref:hypothetical protein n=1 Tax=Tenacibaculum halocynthiae TaxID=1254437 RepID=UPI0038967C6F